jgi:hypothetical protein
LGRIIVPDIVGVIPLGAVQMTINIERREPLAALGHSNLAIRGRRRRYEG